MQHFQFSMIFSLKRKEIGVTQEQVAQYVGVTKAAVSKWEKGQSYPDITLLPKLATYFNLSIDSLLGYEPQMTKEHIQQTYAALAKKFAEKPFAEVQIEIEQLLTEYYACFPFVLQMAQIYLNYCNLAENPTAILDRINELCERVKERSGEYKLVHEAEMLQAFVMIMQAKPDEVLEILGDDVRIDYGAEKLIASAFAMQGKTEKAKETLQVSLYQQMLGMVSNATEMLQFEADNSEYFDETVRRVEAMLALFQIAKLNVNAALVFYLKAASGYMVQQREQDAIDMLVKYCRVCFELQFPIQLSGDDYFYLLDDWIARNINLGAQAPRDELSIKKDLIVSMTTQPMFDSLQQNKEFQSMITNLKHHLQLEEE